MTVISSSSSTRQLPSNSYAVYNIEIPSTKQTFRFRPFLVKEAKALMVANGTNDQTTMMNTLKQVISGTCLDTSFDIDGLAIFDVEYLLLRLRAISVTDPIDILLKCDGDHKDIGARPDIPVNVDLAKVEVANIDKANKTIKLDDDKVVIMRFPDLDVLDELSKPKEEINYVAVVANCIDQIIIGDEIYSADEASDEDLYNWVETLDNMSFYKLSEFFENIPYTRLKVEFDCPLCGKHNVRYLVGLNAFF